MTHLLKILVFISVCLSAAALAQDKNDTATTQEKAQTQKSAPAKEKTSSKHVQQQDSFTPSEKIHADTVVDFPADI